jgi:hypothetical protein
MRVVQMKGARHIAARREHETGFKAIRPTILERDGNRCVKCGSILALEVHHIEGYKRSEPELLITLCYLCHGVAPMGKDHFDKWVSFGTSGSDILLQRMNQNGFKGVTPELILGFCSTLMEFGFELRTSQLRNAREHTKRQNGRCEGIKRFGDLPGEEATLEQILTLRDDGMNGDAIALELTGDTRFPTRSGKAWRGSTIRKIILARRTNTVSAQPEWVSLAKRAVLLRQRKQAEKDARVKQVVLLRQSGMKFTQIAAELNKNLAEDKQTTADAVRDLLRRSRSRTKSNE